jgi:predicted LPLAT superfamily acyltransferase
MAASHVVSKHGVPVNIVAFQGEEQCIHDLMDRATRGRRFSVITVDGSINSSLAIMLALKRGEIVAMHGDRCLGQAGESCEFLGKAARFPTGPYVVAALSGSPVVHAFGIREGMYRYRLIAYPPTELAFSPGLDRSAQIKLWMRAFVDRLENIARQYPLQWQNFYDFWGEMAPDEVPRT